MGPNDRHNGNSNGGSNGIEQLTRDQAHQLLDDQAHRYLHMSGKEFMRAWEAGEFHDRDTPEVMRVAMLLPLGR